MRARLHLQPDDDGGAAEPAAVARTPLEFEDVGGQVVDDADEPESEDDHKVHDTRMMVLEKIQDIKRAHRLLAREKETARGRLPGRAPGACNAMARVANAYGSVIAGVLEPFPVESRGCLGVHGSVPLALEMLARRAEATR